MGTGCSIHTLQFFCGWVIIFFEPIKALKCHQEDKYVEDSYTFVIPYDNDDWYVTNYNRTDPDSVYSPVFLTPGESLKVSKLCNPNFKVYGIYPCETIGATGSCNASVQNHVAVGHFNKNGFVETFLQCPECGCGPEGAPNLNDLYAAEKVSLRKVSHLANIMLNPHE